MKIRFFNFSKIFIFLFSACHCFFVTRCFGAEQTLRVHFIDVGYGDAILVEFPDSSHMLIDAGPPEFSKKLLDYLHSLNITKLNTVLLTHPHKNHFGGLPHLVENLTIDRILINEDKNGEEGYGDLKELLKIKSISTSVLRRGMDIPHLPEGIVMNVLHPEKITSDANNNSLVTFLQFDRTSFLFTGDIAIDAQEELLRLFPFVQLADCVQIPHHGGPISENFVNFFPKAIFVISTGKNKWGIPHKEDLRKIRRKTYRTDKKGTIIIKSNSQTLNLIKPLSLHRTRNLSLDFPL